MGRLDSRAGRWLAVAVRKGTRRAAGRSLAFSWEFGHTAWEWRGDTMGLILAPDVPG